MPVSQWLLILLSLTEMALLFLVVVFFWRLKRSEAALTQLQQKQEEFLTKLRFNAELEQELMASFEERQRQLGAIEDALAKRADELTHLIKTARELAQSPHMLRDLVVKGHRQGKSVQELAKATNLSTDEVELILMKRG
ncbi:MAG: hypothetical protein AB7E47_11995 [Desulfovibrionaceae bacterium]